MKICLICLRGKTREDCSQSGRVSHETIVYCSHFLYLSTQGRAQKPFYLPLQISFIVFCLSRKKTGKLQTQIIMFHCSCRCKENSGHVNFRSSGGKRYTFHSICDETNMLELRFQQKIHQVFLIHFS